MSIRPTEDGGRVAYGDTPWGTYRIEIPHNYHGPIFDADGREIGKASIEFREPDSPADPVNLTVVNAHLAACKECPHAGDVTTTKRGRDVWTIKCKSPRKGCGTVSLRHPKRCPEGKW